MVITTSAAFVLVAGFMMPTVPASSLTHNWLKQPPERRAQPIRDSFESQHIVQPGATETVTKANTHRLNFSSFAVLATTAKLDVYASLQAGWDGEESFAPSPRVVALAKNILDLIPAGLSVPHPMISREGVIGFYWSDDNAFAEIEIDGDDSFSIFAKSRKDASIEIFRENIRVDESTIQVLAECLQPLGRI